MRTHDLAQAYRLMRRLAGGADRHRAIPGAIPIVEDPCILVQSALQETFRPSSPSEIYSDKRPTFIPRSPEEELWIPIDVLFGCYSYKKRTVTIFHYNIEEFASRVLHCNASDLETIVRLHEFCHALVHLGLFWPEEPNVRANYLCAGETNWKAFVLDRSKAFRTLSSEAHEFLAQSLCWMTVGMLEPLSRRNSLQDQFMILMNRQPPEYQLGPEMLGKSCYADPTALLSWVREIPRY